MTDDDLHVIQDFEELLEVFGGVTKLARALGVKKSFVSNMRKDGRVAPSKKLEAYLAAKEKGYLIAPSVLG